MSSATKVEPYAARMVSGAMADKMTQGNARGMRLATARAARLGMTPRQQHLNQLWSTYTCCRYDARAINWDGKTHASGIEAEAIATAGFIPPGFYDAGATFPLRFRRPTAPYHLAKVITDRFTGLLFSERRHPKLRVEDDPVTEDFVQALAAASRLWQSMIQARTFGGATGTFCVGFQFVDGKPIIEVHDPRWVYPDFIDRGALKLRSVEKLFQYPEDAFDPESGRWVTVPMWYRRILDEQWDVVFKPVPVGDGDEPAWEMDEAASVEHGLGFCPVVWGQNVPVQDDVDGEPDCHGIFDMIEAIDALISQANRGILYNSDPTTVIISQARLDEVRKGSDNAIKLPDGSASYMEMSGTGPKAAMDMAETLRRYALEVAQCVLEHPDVATRTATEVDRSYSSMHAKADIMREQYGQRCVLPLVEMMVRAARKLGEPTVDVETGEMVRQRLILPTRVERDGDAVKSIERRLGKGGTLSLQWGGYTEPTLDEALRAVQAAAAARAAGLVDLEHAVDAVAQYFRVEDVGGLVKKLESDAVQQQADMTAMSMGGYPPLEEEPFAGDAPPEAEPAYEDRGAVEEPAPATQAPTDVRFFQYEIEGGIVTINEVRASKGLGPIPDGDLTMPQYRAKNAAMFAQAVQTTTDMGANQILGEAKPAPEPEEEA